MSILVVETDLRLAELVQLIFEAAGHPCLVAQDIEEALWLLRVADIEGLVLDLGGPGESALPWLEALLSVRPELAERTVVLASRSLRDEETSRLEALGAAVIRRPFQIEPLREVVLRRVGSPPRAGAA